MFRETQYGFFVEEHRVGPEFLTIISSEVCNAIKEAVATEICVVWAFFKVKECKLRGPRREVSEVDGV